VASPQPTPFVRISQEWLRAVMLFGRLNGSEWAVLMVIAHDTWGFSRKEASIGMAQFRAKLPGTSEAAIRKALHRLTRPTSDNPKRSGYALVHVVAQHTAERSTRYELNKDWETWPWRTVEELEHARVRLAPFEKGKGTKDPPKKSRTIPDNVPPLAAGIHAIANRVPHANIPTQDLTDATWRRWCGSILDLIERQHTVDDIAACIRWAAHDPFWQSRLTGRNADRRFVSGFDTIYASASAANNRRR